MNSGEWDDERGGLVAVALTSQQQCLFATLTAGWGTSLCAIAILLNLPRRHLGSCRMRSSLLQSFAKLVLCLGLLRGYTNTDSKLRLYITHRSERTNGVGCRLCFGVTKLLYFMYYSLFFLIIYYSSYKKELKTKTIAEHNTFRAIIH